MNLMHKLSRRMRASVVGAWHFRRLPPFVPLFSDGSFERIYHIHSRKTAGTSVNTMFLALCGTPDVVELYEELARPPYNVGWGDWSYSAWTNFSLRHPQFHYGFSHVPLHRLSLPARTFRFTVLRDPVSRTRSLYDMLAGYRDMFSRHPDHQHQIEWVKDGFSGFLSRTPRDELMGQLAMFSPRLDVEEGLAALSAIEMAIPLAALGDGMAAIGRRFGLPLVSQHVRAAQKRYEPSSAELDELRQVIFPELAFYEQALALENAQPDRW